MNNELFIFKVRRKIAFTIIKIIQYFRVMKYQLISLCNIEGKPHLNQPVFFYGKGKVIFKGNVNIGVLTSPLFLNSYAYFDVREENSSIIIEDGVWINNNASLCADGTSIFIGRNTLVGINLQIITSDGHNLDPKKRTGYPYVSSPVFIDENVFIGSNVTILKGVTIGKNSVIANCSVVTKDIPENVIAGGIPATILKKLES